MRPSSSLLHRWTSPAAFATVRTSLGVVLLLAPQVVPRVLGVDAAARARTTWLGQMLGVREIALGAGVLAADRSQAARAFALAGSVCDLVDAVVVAAAVRRGDVDRPWGRAVALSALAAGLVGTGLVGPGLVDRGLVDRGLAGR